MMTVRSKLGSRLCPGDAHCHDSAISEIFILCVLKVEAHALAPGRYRARGPDGVACSAGRFLVCSEIGLWHGTLSTMRSQVDIRAGVWT
jgi:hypothetical protein